MRMLLSTRWALLPIAVLLVLNSTRAADVNLNNGWEAFPTPESKAAAIKLGKALFWDEQLGSGNGGQYACASCHYQAGADSHPLRIEAGRLPSGIFGSLGVQAANFRGIAAAPDANAPGGLCATPCDDFEITGELAITGRNAPPSVDSNSIHNFWDGRANFVFNGLDPSGEVRPGLFTASGMKSVMILESSQASQAVGPPNSDVEMAAVGRTNTDLGWKMCHVVPLASQTGDIVDVLEAEGLRVPGGYITMIEAAFGDGPLAEFVSSEIAPDVFARICTSPGVVEQSECCITEANFTLFFGLAIQAYEQTLSSVPAKTPSKAMVKAFKEMRCNKCHYEDGRSHAVIGDVGRSPFDVTGVAPLSVDPGATAEDINASSPFPNDEVDADVGFFKSSHLFNLPLTAPYFHDGSAATIEEMMDFYIRGGNHDLKKLSSQIRVLDASPREISLVTEMMEILTDPRIGAGTGPFAHPSLKLPLADGSHLQMRASDDPAALADTMPGLSYVHVTADGTDTTAPPVADDAPAGGADDPPAADADEPPAADEGNVGNGDAAAGKNKGRRNRRDRGARRKRDRTR